MNLATSLLFYLVFGCAVGTVVHVAGDGGRSQRWFHSVTAVFFWPLYLPAVLRRPPDGTPLFSSTTSPTPGCGDHSQDEVSSAIQQVEAELNLALGSLDGWSDAVLAREQHRFTELRTAWHAQAQKIRELDHLLGQPAFAQQPETHPGDGCSDRVATCERSRRDNIDRLRAVRTQLHNDLFNTLAWVRELVTMIHLAKYTGAPASRAEELVMQIATAVEGLSEVAGWREP